MELIVFIFVWSVFFIGGNVLEKIFFDDFQAFVFSRYTNTTNVLANLIHGVFVVIFCFIAAFDNPSLSDPLNPFQHMLMMVSLAFFLVDLVALLIFRHPKLDIYFHHLLCIGAILAIKFSGTAAGYLLLFFAAGEMGFLFYVDLLAKRWQVKNERFLQINESLNLFNFLISRIFILGTVLFVGLATPENHIAAKILASIFWGLSLYWCYSISVRYVKRYPNTLFSRVFAATLLRQQPKAAEASAEAMLN